MARVPIADDVVTVSVRISAAILAAVDVEAARLGVTRSTLLRTRIAGTAALVEPRDRAGRRVPAIEEAPMPTRPGCAHRWVQRKSTAVGTMYVCDRCDARSLTKPRGA